MSNLNIEDFILEFPKLHPSKASLILCKSCRSIKDKMIFYGISSYRKETIEYYRKLIENPENAECLYMIKEIENQEFSHNRQFYLYHSNKPKTIITRTNNTRPYFTFCHGDFLIEKFNWVKQKIDLRYFINIYEFDIKLK